MLSAENIYHFILPINLVAAESIGPEIGATHPIFLFCKNKFSHRFKGLHFILKSLIVLS